jgi:hypothetical protein
MTDQPGLWSMRVRREEERLGRQLTLEELLQLARTYTMTPHEIELQRQSWARQMMD